MADKRNPNTTQDYDGGESLQNFHSNHQINKDIEFVGRVLGPTYFVVESNKRGSVHCKCRYGKGIDDEEKWGYIFLAIIEGRDWALSERYYPNTLKYNCNWSWLMPVWYKFRDLKFEIEPHLSRHSNHKNLIGRQILYGSIGDTHIAAFNALCWYNKTIKSE